MAVWCGVCATQLGSAMDNFGLFVASDKFNGWPKVEPGEHHIVIRDTCESCSQALRDAVAVAANAIAAKHTVRITAHAQQLEQWEQERRERDEFNRNFEQQRDAAWQERFNRLRNKK